MDNISKNKIKTNILLMLTVVIFLFATEYISDIYENDDKEIPKWLFYTFYVIGMSVIGIAYNKVNNAFKKNKNIKA